jgi:7,8-dihydro-6-hydroxymethylpterin dimethyltransferase
LNLREKIPAENEIALRSDVRKRKDYVFLETTRSLCSDCLRMVDAKVLLQKGRIILTKRCPQHGEQTALLHSDSRWYLDSLKYNRPGDIPVRHAGSVVRGCPYDCGFCPDHEQHACLSLIDITDACNLNCPTCFSNSRGASFLTHDQICGAIDGAIAQEGPGVVLQFSGGEPTLHPGLVDAVAAAMTRPVDVLMINSNGLRFAADEDLVRRLRDAGGWKLEIYLQFDGFNDNVYRTLRGVPLYDTKMRAIENLTRHGIPITLSCLVKRGVNEGEMGKVVEFGARTAGIRGVAFQPAFFSGRCPDIDPLDRVTGTEVMQLIESQTGGMFKQSDFVPLPCSFPSQIALTYAYVKGNKVKPIPRMVAIDRYLDQWTNTIFPEQRHLLRQAIDGLWSAGASFNSLRVLWDFVKVCGLPLPGGMTRLDAREWAAIADRHAFRISIIQFQDRYSFDLKVAKKSCIGQALPDGRIIPFDVYNTLYRTTHDVQFWAEGARPAPIEPVYEKGPAS